MAVADVAAGWWSALATTSNKIPKHVMQQEQQLQGSGYVPLMSQEKGQSGTKGKNKGRGRGKGKTKLAEPDGREKGKAKMARPYGRGKGNAEGPGPRTTQIDALQGLWAEAGRSKKQWLIKGYTATEVTSGEMGRKFTVQEGTDGSVGWGTNGKYFLDRRFRFGMETAIWRLRSPDGTEAFSWRCVKMLPPSGEALPLELLEAGCRAGNAPVDGRAGPSFPGERRTDPADGGAYTWQEMRARYAGEYTKRESEAYWEACKVVKPPEDVQVERRIDPDDGNIYTWEEVAAHYGSEFPLQEIREYWGHCKVVSWAMPQRRIDPADGMPYTWREMKAFYANEYTLSATVAYWDACKEEDPHGE